MYANFANQIFLVRQFMRTGDPYCPVKHKRRIYKKSEIELGVDLNLLIFVLFYLKNSELYLAPFLRY